jgi:hypothetical protein
MYLGFYETRRFITMFTEPAIGPYPKPDESSPHPYTKSFKDTLLH